MRSRRVFGTVFFVLICLLLQLVGSAFADVQPGDVIDKTNWQKLEGLVPASVLNWVKKGDFILQIGKLNYDPGDYFPDFQMKAFKTDVGKYALDENDAGEWLTTAQIRRIPNGYQVKGWQGAPWAPTNLVWLKRHLYIFEMRPKDPYYNYGCQETWVDAQTFAVMYKVINDKAGDYWKTFYTSSMCCASDDKRLRFWDLAGQYVVDDRRDYATTVEDASPRNIWAYWAVLDPHDFTLGGFQKFCK